jgi:glyoxylase-like metal-dependent hydrolase (beta-lactamase superfamily II)
MRQSIAIAAAAALVGVLPRVAASQEGLDTVRIRTQQLSANVYLLQGAGGNIGLAVGNDAVFVVDDQFAPLTPKILAAIAAVTPKPVRFVVNTHWHFDHTGGNENMGKAGALLVAHENVRKRMSTDQFIEAINRRQPASPPGALPVVTFTEGVTFHINDDDLVVTHVPPAHTDGDAIVFFTKANVIHMGDLFVTVGLPFIDRSSGGSIHGVIGAAERALTMANGQTKIIPGHGAVADRARLESWRNMLAALRDKVQAEIRAGKTLEQVLASKVTEPYAKEWPSNHERFLRAVYQELSAR